MKSLKAILMLSLASYGMFAPAMGHSWDVVGSPAYQRDRNIPEGHCTTSDLVVCRRMREHFRSAVQERLLQPAAYFNGLERVTLSVDSTRVSSNGTRVSIAETANANQVYDALALARLIRQIRSLYDDSVSIQCETDVTQCLRTVREMRSLGNGLSLASQCEGRTSGSFECDGLWGIFITIGQGNSSIHANYVVSYDENRGVVRSDGYNLNVFLNTSVSRAQIWNLFTNLSDTH